MSAERYTGAEGLTRKQQDEDLNSGRARSDAQDERRDRQVRLPAGRALDLADVDMLLDQGNQSWRANILRQRLLAEIRKNLPAGILLDRHELEQLIADSIEHPTRAGVCPKVAEWPASR